MIEPEREINREREREIERKKEREILCVCYFASCPSLSHIHTYCFISQYFCL